MIVHSIILRFLRLHSLSPRLLRDSPRRVEDLGSDQSSGDSGLGFSGVGLGA